MATTTYAAVVLNVIVRLAGVGHCRPDEVGCRS
jgi:hypothetical protein